MKKLIRYFLIFIAIIALFAVITVAVLTRPGFQKSIFLDAMKEKVDAVQVDSLAAGFSGARVNHLKVEQNGAVIEIASASITYSLWDIALKKEIRVGECKISGLLVDLRHQKPAVDVPKHPHSGEKEKPFPEFKGIFENTTIPAKVFIGTVSVDGRVLMPKREIDFDVTGGGIAPGKSGQLALKGTVTDQSPGAAAEALSIDSTLIVGQTDAQALNRIEFNADLQASGGSLSQTAELSLASVATREADTEHYTLLVNSRGKPVAEIQSTYTSASEIVQGTMTANVTRQDIAPFVIGADLPDFVLSMNNQFTLNGKKDQIDTAGTLTADLKNLGQWKSELEDIGSATIHATVQTTVLPQHVQMEAIAATLDAAGGRRLLELQLKRKFAVEIENGRPMMDAEPGELLAITLSNLPVQWLAPFSPTKLSGGNISGATVLSLTGKESFSLQSTQPWAVGRLSVAHDNQSVLDSVDIAMRPGIDVNGDNVSVQLDGLQFASGGKTLLTGNAELATNIKNPATQTTIDARFRGDLAQLQAQPVLKKFHGLAGGKYDLAAKVKPAAGGELDVTASLALSELTLRQTFQTLKGASLNLTGTIDGTEKIDLKGPLTLTGRRTSDAVLLAQVDRREGINKFTIEASGNTLVYDDLNFLRQALKNPDQAEAAAPSRPKPSSKTTSEPDSVASWNGNEGTIVVNFDTVYWGANELTGLEFALDVDAARLDVSKLAAQLNGAPVKANARIDFRSGNPDPYLLDASVDLENLEVGSLLSKDGNPQNAGVTGEFTIQGTTSGAAPTLPALGDRVAFDLQLNGGPGVVRSLKSNAVVSTAAGSINLATGFAGLIGGKTVTQNPAVATIHSLLDAISEAIEYQTISFSANRGADLNTKLEEFLLISPQHQIKFKGTGGITYRAGGPIATQPMNIACTL